VKFQPRPAEEPDLNLTPLIDVVLLLLIFFMLSTRFIDEGRLQLRLPEAGVVPEAAAEAEVFPVDAQMTESEPSAFAFETAIVIPRSLKEPVGFSPSYFRYSEVPGAIRRASAGAGTRGVFPSSSVTTASSGTEVKNRP